MEQLIKALNAEGINASVDKSTGQIGMDTSVFFAVADATISEDGKAYLDKFLKVYADVILPFSQQGVVSTVLVEGHTDTDGSYESNLTLSEQRAESVKSYCLSIQPDLASIMSVKGCSYLNPIYNEDGSINMAASRRVVFKFVLNVPN